MPDPQPSNAADPEDRPTADARDDRTAAKVLAEDDRADNPGGGALIGGGHGGNGAMPAGGASPNSPLGDGIGGGDPDAEARTLATKTAPDENHPVSR